MVSKHPSIKIHGHLDSLLQRSAAGLLMLGCWMLNLQALMKLIQGLAGLMIWSLNAQLLQFSSSICTILFNTYIQIPQTLNLVSVIAQRIIRLVSLEILVSVSAQPILLTMSPTAALLKP